MLQLVASSDSIKSTVTEVKSKVILLFYHGGPFGDGQIKKSSEDDTGDTGRIYNEIVTYIRNKKIEWVGAIIAPAKTQGPGSERGAKFLKDNHKTKDKVIIYGYSYGGDNAVVAGEIVKNITIDLMIIVDSTDGPLRGITINDVISDNVKLAYNFYQEGYSGRWGTSIGSSGSGSLSGSLSGSSSSGSSGGSLSGSSSGSSGGSSGGSSDSSGSGSGSSETSNFPGSKGHPRFTSKKATVVNERINVKGVTHGNIQMKAKEEILSPMKKVIDSL